MGIRREADLTQAINESKKGMVNMSEYFIIFNTTKAEYLNPFSIDEPANLESVIGGTTSKLLAYLLVTKETNETRFKGKPNQLKGSWQGDKIQILGDHENESFYHSFSHQGNDITTEALMEYSQIDHTIDPEKH